MKSGEIINPRGIRPRLVSVIPLLGLALLAVGWAAESPERMEARRLAQQGQTQRDGGKTRFGLPVADGSQDRLGNWLTTVAASHSILQDNFVAHTGLNSVTAAPGLKLAATSYDFQHNDAAPHQIGTNGSRQYIHFTWTHWDVIPESLNQVDRFVHFNSYNSALGTFIYGLDGILMSGAGGDPLRLRAGFTTLDLDDANRARIAYHQRDAPEQPSGDYSSWVLEQSDPGFAVFTENLMFNSKGVVPNADDDVIWPHITVDQRPSGSDYFHVLSHVYSSNDNIMYWRNKNSTWTGPYVIDSTPYLSYNIAADRTSDKCALVTLNDTPYPANPNGILQVVYRESAVDGDDWGPINATGLGDSKRFFITNYNTSGGPGAWLEVVGDYDNSGKLHVVWVEQHRNTGGEQAALKHWDDISNTISTTHQAYYDCKGEVGVRDLNIAFPTIGFGDGSTICGTGTNLNYVYTTFVQFGGITVAQQSDMSSRGYMNGDIYLSSSTDGGTRWSPAKNLTNTMGPGCNPSRGDSCPSENWPSIARTVDDTLHIMYLNDRDAGDAVLGCGSWTFNPVMYYRIPGGANVQPVCPLIAPNAGMEFTDANGSECEYNTPPGTTISEQLILSNVGNATMTGQVSTQYLNPPSGTWLQMNTGNYSIPPGGADLTYPVTMVAAALTEGLYRAQIYVTHNDPTKTSPFVIPVDFFVFNSFACPKSAVLHTQWLELEVSNVDRVAMGPTRSPSEGIESSAMPASRGVTRGWAAGLPFGGGSGHLRGLYRPPRFGSPDSGNYSIYDASLIIARPPTDITRPPDGVLDTVVYRYLFGQGNYAKGFRALSDLQVDTSRYGTGSGIAYARANQSTIDSIIGVDVEYQFPQNTDSSNFVLVTYKIYNRTTGSISGLMIGEAADFDIVPSSQYSKYQVGLQNKAGFSTNMNLIYQQGADTGAVPFAQKYMGGMTAIRCGAAPRAWIAPNDPWLFKRNGGGFHEGYLYQQLVKNAFEIIPPGPAPSRGGVDQHAVLAFEKNVTLAPTTVKHYALGFVTSTSGPDTTDLMATTRKAWRFAFGWQDVVTTDTVLPGMPASYPYWASGSHENGSTSPCCGCVVSKVSGAAELSIVAGTDPCSGVINFAGTSTLGTYTATFRVTTKTGGCAGPTYTDDQVVSILVCRDPGCNCPNQGDVANNDMAIDVFDVVQEIAISFNGGADTQDPACPTTRGDVNSDMVVDVFDVVYLIEMVFTGGPPPVEGCSAPCSTSDS